MQRYRSGHNGADSKSVWEQSHEGSNPSRCATSPRTTYRSRRLFYKSHLSLILSRLLSKPDPLSLGSGLGPPLCGGFFWSPEDIDFGSTGPLWEDRPTGHPAGGAFAPYKRFRLWRKPWRRGGSADPEHRNTEGWRPPKAAGTQKERHDLWSCLSFWKGRLKSIFPRNRTNPPQSGGPKSQPSVSGCDLERRSSGVSAL